MKLFKNKISYIFSFISNKHIIYIIILFINKIKLIAPPDRFILSPSGSISRYIPAEIDIRWYS